MRWILQDFEDTRKLGDVLARLGLTHSWHKVVPFVGTLQPDPVMAAGEEVILFGSYTLWRYAKAHGLRPGVFRIRPFLHEGPWQAHMLNGPNARVLPLAAIPKQVPADDRPWFLRPTDDSKEIAGGVKSGREIVEIAQKVLALPEDDLPRGSLNHQSELMLCPPAHINAEWRLWVVDDVVVTWSLYRFGPRVVYRPEIDDDALAFARDLVAANPRYAPAYVMDVCRTTDGLRMLETNCLNAAGFYAADLNKLVMALEDLSSRTGTWT